ncbi:hypothetical protein Bhyg_08056, partial [Pseudolycoriella hygida]
MERLALSNELVITGIPYSRRISGGCDACIFNLRTIKMVLEKVPTKKKPKMTISLTKHSGTKYSSAPTSEIPSQKVRFQIRYYITEKIKEPFSLKMDSKEMKFIQINLHHCKAVTSILLIQEPWTNAKKTAASSAHSSTAPHLQSLRKRNSTARNNSLTTPSVTERRSPSSSTETSLLNSIASIESRLKTIEDSSQQQSKFDEVEEAFNELKAMNAQQQAEIIQLKSDLERVQLVWLEIDERHRESEKKVEKLSSESFALKSEIQTLRSQLNEAREKSNQNPEISDSCVHRMQTYSSFTYDLSTKKKKNDTKDILSHAIGFKFLQSTNYREALLINYEETVNILIQPSFLEDKKQYI